MGRPDRSGDGPVMGAAAFLSMGFQLVASALGGLYLGSLLDRGRQSQVFAPLGLLSGLLVGFYRAYVLVRSTIRKRR
jgi:F0F1-type ATP synthase assembly protein I